MPFLVLTQVTKRTVRMDRFETPGAPVEYVGRSKFMSDSAIREFARLLKTPFEWLQAALDSFERAPNLPTPNGQRTLVLELPTKEKRVAEQVFSVRDMFSSESTDYKTFEAAVFSEPKSADPVVSWTSRDDVCALDLDVDVPYTDQDLTNLLTYFTPKPQFAWVTKGGGYRFVYLRDTVLTAFELACLGRYNLLGKVVCAGVEVKTETRLPGLARVQRNSLSLARAAYYRTDFSVDKSALAVWLRENDYEIGRRYPHTRCPFNPQNTKPQRDPVIVTEEGIFCPHPDCGFKSFGRLMGGDSAWTVWTCAGKAVHWEHARHEMVHDCGFEDKYSRVVYRAMMKLCEVSKARTRLAMERHNIIWCDGYYWSRASSMRQWGKNVEEVLNNLPAFHRDDGAKSRAHRESVAEAMESDSREDFGYREVIPIIGCRLMPVTSALTCIVQAKLYAKKETAQFRAKYTPSDKRMSFDSAKAVVETAVPGVNWNAVILHLHAKAWTEHRLGLFPMTFLYGASETGKSGSVAIASAIAGTTFKKVLLSENYEDVLRNLVIAKRTATYVFMDEWAKNCDGRAKDRLTPFLSVGEEHLSRLKYENESEFGSMVPFIFADTSVPTEVQEDTQLGRRSILVPMTTGIDWRESLVKTGVRDPLWLRLAGGDYTLACNSILSWFMDEFREPLRYDEAARVLGFLRMCDSEAAIENLDFLRNFIKLLLAEPEVSGNTNFNGRGWKMVNLEVRTPFQEAWLNLCDDRNSPTTSRTCSSVDWQKVMKLKEPSRLEISKLRGRQLCLRLKSVAGTRKDYRVNVELLKENT